MSAAVLTTTAAASSNRLLAHVKALAGSERTRTSAQIRLQAAIGRDLADRLVTALSSDPRR